MRTTARVSIGAAVLSLGLLLTPAAGAAAKGPEKPRSVRVLTGLLRWVDAVIGKVTQKEGACTAGEVADSGVPLACPDTSGAQAASEIAGVIDPDG